MRRSRLNALGIALMAVGVALRFVTLGRQSLWFDEILAARDASGSLRQIHRVVLASPPLFHYGLHLLQSIGLHSDSALRFLPALFGALAIPLFFAVLRRHCGAEPACWGTALLAVSPFHLFFSQEVRMYSLLFLLALISWVLFEHALEWDRWRDWIAFSAVSLLGAYTHNWFLFLIVSQTVLVAMQASQRGGMAFLSIGLGYMPWLPMLWAQAHAPIFEFLPRPGFSELLHTWHAFIGVSVPCGAGSLTLSLSEIRVATACSLVLFIAGLWSAGRDVELIRIALGGLFLPLLLAVAVSRWGPASVYHPGRYTLMVLPAFLWICAAAFRERGRLLKYLRLGAAVWMLMDVHAITRYFTTYEKAPWRRLVQEGSKQDSWLSDPIAQKSLAYYARQRMAEGR